jgi:predicted transcriptional regulator
VGDNSFNRENPAAYGFLFSPPPPENSGILSGIRLDSSRLIVQWVMLTGVLAITFAYMGKSKDSTKTRVFSDVNLNEDLLKNVVQALAEADVGYHPELDGEKYRNELKKTSDMIARSLLLRNADDEQIYFALDSVLQERINGEGILKNDHIDSSIITWMKYH